MPAVLYVSYVALWVLVITESLLLLLVCTTFRPMALSTAEGVYGGRAYQLVSLLRPLGA